MKEKELLSQLNNLKNIKPDDNWKRESRDVLMSQIYAGDYSLTLNEQEDKGTLMYYVRNFIHQPVLVVATILLIVFGSGAISIKAARDTKPGDSLYIAKIISEKTRATFTFNEESKAKYGIELASRRARELSEVLAEPNGNGGKAEKVEKLTKNFKREISAVKLRLANMNMIDIDEVADEDLSAQAEDSQIFSANLGKEEDGMQIYIQEDEAASPSADGEEEGKALVNQEDILITTPENITEASSTSEVSSDIEKAFEEAEQLLAEEDYSGTVNKLEEVMDSIIDNINSDNEGEARLPKTGTVGQVKGESELSLPDGNEDTDSAHSTGSGQAHSTGSTPEDGQAGQATSTEE